MKLTTAKKRNLNKYKLKKKLYMTFSYIKYHLNPGAEQEGSRGGQLPLGPTKKKPQSNKY